MEGKEIEGKGIDLGYGPRRIKNMSRAFILFSCLLFMGCDIDHTNNDHKPHKFFDGAVTPLPEPSAAVLFGTGLIIVAIKTKRKR